MTLKIKYWKNSGDAILSSVSEVGSTKLYRSGLKVAFFTYVHKEWKKQLDLLH